MGSHWERTILLDEIMTGEAVATDAQLSIFTIALLKDTGFFAEVNENMADNINWGKNKGCDFYYYSCQSKTSLYAEFAQNEESLGCSFESDGFG